MTFTTRKPTGLPAWPIGLIAGVEKSGKSWKAVEASASPMIHRTFWVGVGEDDPDEYGIVPGADFEIVEHDGTYRGILNALLEAGKQDPGPNGEPNLIVLDSISRVWVLLTDSIQATANERWARKNQNRQIPDDGIRPSMDLWNVAKDRWAHIIDALRAHQGPSLITARLELVTAMDDSGNPTKEKWWKPAGEKNLVYEVGYVVQMRSSFPEHDDHLSGVKSARYKHPVDAHGKAVPAALSVDWSVEWLWTQLGLADAVGGRQHAHTVVESEDQVRNQLLMQVKEAAEAANVALDVIANDWAESHNGQMIHETTDIGGLEVLVSDLRIRAEHKPDTEQEQTPDHNDPVTSGGEGLETTTPSREDVVRVTEALGSAKTFEELRDVWRLGSELKVLDVALEDGTTIGATLMARRDAVTSGASG